MNFLQSVDSSRKETIFFLLICVCVVCMCDFKNSRKRNAS